MKIYEELKTTDYLKIPKGTEIFSIALQMNVIVTKDEIIRVSGICCVTGIGYIFGIVQTSIFGSFRDKAHAEIGLDYSKCVELEESDKPQLFFPYLDIVYSPQK